MALILNSRSNATAGNVPASDVSSPDLGVDLGSDPFSSLERTNDISLVQQLGNCIFCWLPYTTKTRFFAKALIRNQNLPQL